MQLVVSSAQVFFNVYPVLVDEAEQIWILLPTAEKLGKPPPCNEYIYMHIYTRKYIYICINIHIHSQLYEHAYIQKKQLYIKHKQHIMYQVYFV